MTCRHEKGDPNCGSHPSNVYEQARKDVMAERERKPKTPDANNYTIEDVADIGPHLVVKVKYPNCAKCAYEGNKVMVFLGVSTLQAMKWRTIDPHFRDPGKVLSASEAQPPSARFPASEEGWGDAIAYARSKMTDFWQARQEKANGKV